MGFKMKKGRVVILGILLGAWMIGNVLFTGIQVKASEEGLYGEEGWKEYYEDEEENGEYEGEIENSGTEQNGGSWWQIIPNSENTGIEEKEGEETEGDDEDDFWRIEKPTIDMTNVTLEKNQLKGRIIDDGSYGGSSIEFSIKVNSETVLDEDTNSEVYITSETEDMYFEPTLKENVLMISTYSVGKTMIKVNINGKEFPIDIEVDRIGFEKYYYLLAKGEKANISLIGVEKEGLKWKSSKPSVVSVDGKGRIKGLKEGNAIITVEIEGKKIGTLVSSVAKVKKKAIHWAMKYVEKSKYSQPKRMMEGFFDCSSLVWKAYNKFGYKLGGMNYAPTAADLCRIYVNKKQTLKGGASYENIEKLKILPGDLVFATGGKNGRYKNIYHVEMVAGYYFSGFNEEGKPDVGLQLVRLSEYSSDLPVARPKVK